MGINQGIIMLPVELLGIVIVNIDFISFRNIHGVSNQAISNSAKKFIFSFIIQPFQGEL